MSFMQEIETDSMGTRQLHSSQKEAMKKIIEFSGELNETDIDEWLFDLNNLFSLMKLKDETKILETMGKLTGPALRWYQENLRSFTKWDDAEKALRDRFKEFTLGTRQFITEQQVITVLQSGVKLSLKEYLIRNEKDIRRPEEWLQIAREEEYMQNRIQQQRNNFYYETKKQPFFESTLPSATIQSRPLNIRSSSRQTPTPHDSYPKQYRQLTPVPNDRIHQKQNNYERTKHNWKMYPENKMPRSDSCLICNRKNHSTMNCFYKKDNGCFKCGQSNHRIRDCPEQHFFE
ncbi:unnamed protein product [Rotaria magnacalcarata]